MIKFPSIPELKSMWNKPNSKKDNKEEEKPNKSHEEYLEISDKKDHDAVEKVWKELEKRRRNMLENMSILRNAEKAYEKYRMTMECILAHVYTMNEYTDTIFMRIISIVIGPFSIHTMETYYEIIGARLKSMGIEMTREIFYNYIKRIP